MIRYASKLSVIIPTMNRPYSLKRTVEKMLSSIICPAEIIIIDQTQKESIREQNRRLVEWAEAFGTRCCYLYQKEASSTKARNLGIKYATKEILLFSDDDVDVDNTTFENIETLFADPQIALVAGIDNNTTLDKGNPLGYLLGTKSWRKRKIGHVTRSMLGRFPCCVKEDVETEWAMGFFFAVRRSLVIKWKLQFDKNLTSYAYAEDLDFSYTYCQYAKKCDMKCICSPRIRVNHLGSKEYRVPSRRSIFMYVINREYLSYKHRLSRFSRIVMRWTNFWIMISSIRKPEIMKLYWEAQARCDQNRKHLKCGIIPDDIYE